MSATRQVFLGAIIVAGLLVPGSPVGAAPTSSGTVLEFDCGNSRVNVLLSPGGGNKSWSVDDARVTDGVTYHVKTFEIRIYPGVLTSEPTDQDPAAVWSHSYGERLGQGEPIVCQGTRPIGGASTGFITVAATSQR